ncbi:MAG: YCF48-related protein, partial [Vicinamibacterales bacterium]
VPPLPPEPLVISSPNRNFRWRVTGLDVERTSDGGDVWRKQNVALARTVVAGTAPSAAVCWLVGQAGSVFLAVGSEWKDVSMTRKVDLVKVAAIDSMNATVTASDGTLFSTSDAGVTWTALTQ